MKIQKQNFIKLFGKILIVKYKLVLEKSMKKFGNHINCKNISGEMCEVRKLKN